MQQVSPPRDTGAEYTRVYFRIEMASKPSGLRSKFWDVASKSEQKHLSKHPELIPKWSKLCRARFKVESIASVISNGDGRLTRKRYAKHEEMHLQEQLRSASLVVDATDDDKEEASITKDEQWGVSKEYIDNEFVEHYNFSLQDGANCLYIAMRMFDAFRGHSITELRRIAADTISNRVETGEYCKDHVVHLHKGMRMDTIVAGHRGAAWGTSACVDAICRTLGARVMVVQEPTHPDQPAAAHVFPGRDNRIGTRVESKAEFDSFDGPILMNQDNVHWIALTPVISDAVLQSSL